MRSPWNGGITSLRRLRWGCPSSTITDWLPRNGTSDAAIFPACMSSPWLAKTSRTCSGFERITMRGVDTSFTVKVSPKRARHSFIKPSGSRIQRCSRRTVGIDGPGGRLMRRR